MANKIKVRSGLDTQRTQSTTIDEREIHYSTSNADGEGRPERLWIADSAAEANNSDDLLIGPFHFVEGPSGKIRVTANYQTGKVEIDWREPSTFNPTMSRTLRATNYSNNATLEAGDSFNSPTGHDFTITSINSATELPIDWGTYSYQLVGAPSAVSGSFPAPINAQNDGNTISGGTASTQTIVQTFPTPASFTLSSINTRRQSVTINARTSTADGNVLDTDTFHLNFGWRVRGFISQTLFGNGVLPTPAQINAGSSFHYISQTPTSATSYNTTKFVLPNDGGSYHLYLVHTCGQNNVGSGQDEYGWIPSLVQTNSQGVVTASINPVEVTDYVGGDVLIDSLGSTNGSALGNQTAKAYRVWRLTSAPQPGNGDTVHTIIT